MSAPSTQPAGHGNAGDQTRHGVRWVFVGPNGIRAGWSILIFIAILLALTVPARVAMSLMVRGNPSMPLSPRAGLAMEGVLFVLVLVATAVMALIERRPISFYGYQGAHGGVRFLSGLVWGFVAISVLVGALWKAHLLVFDDAALGGGGAMRNGVKWAIVFAFGAAFEESTLRGYPQFTATRGIGFWWSALVLSLVFALLHGANPGESPLGLGAVVAVGLVFCLSLWYTGTLWWAVGFHAAWDWGETYFYGTADSGMTAQGHLLTSHPAGAALWSGGSTGPEGSVLVLPLLLLVALAMWGWWGRRTTSPFSGGAWRPIAQPNR